MKNSIITTWILLFALISAQAQTPGNLSVSATTSSTGGNFAPKNIVAMWIEDEQGNFVKTLLAYAQNRKTHLNTWEASTTAAGSPFNTVDAITGATKTSHATRTCSWDATDVNGNIVPDGTYKLRMELTDKNGTGNFSTFTFSKDTLPVTLTPANVPSFSSISINWEPVITSIKDASLYESYSIYPNPSSGIFQIKGEKFQNVRIVNSSGVMVLSSENPVIDIRNQPDGIYYVIIFSDKGTITKKIMKNRE
jgi:hypothetical protein